MSDNNIAAYIAQQTTRLSDLPADLNPAVTLPDLFPPERRLVGRADELAQLCHALDTVQTSRAIVITGLAGMGRLALARTLAQYARAKNIPVIVGRFWPTQRVSEPRPLWADDALIGPDLMDYGPYLAAEWPQAQRVGDASPDCPVWSAVAAQMARLLDSADPAPGYPNGPDEFASLTRRMLQDIAHRHPVLLLLENLNAAPSPWLDLLGQLVGQSWPCLVVATTSPGSTAHQMAQALPHTDLLALEPVTHVDITGFLQPVRNALSWRLFQLTGGISVDAVWQTWLDSGWVEQSSEGTWQSSDLGHEFIFWRAQERARRLLALAYHEDDALFEYSQAIAMLTMAAMEGYTFTAAAIARVIGTPVDTLTQFWDEHLVGVILAQAGDGLYRFANVYIWHVWRDHPLENRHMWQRKLADAVEAASHPQVHAAAASLIPMFEATSQVARAAAYRRYRDFNASDAGLRWQVETVTEPARRFEVLVALSRTLHLREAYHDALTHARDALSLDVSPDRLAEAHHRAALSSHALGDYDAAQHHYHQSLTLYQDTLTNVHPITATVMNHLGLLCHELQQWDNAQQYLGQALAYRRRTLGDHHPETAESLNNVGRLLVDRQENLEARFYLEQALAVVGPQHPLAVTVQANLARLN